MRCRTWFIYRLQERFDSSIRVHSSRTRTIWPRGIPAADFCRLVLEAFGRRKEFQIRDRTSREFDDERQIAGSWMVENKRGYQSTERTEPLTAGAKSTLRIRKLIHANIMRIAWLQGFDDVLRAGGIKPCLSGVVRRDGCHVQATIPSLVGH